MLLGVIVATLLFIAGHVCLGLLGALPDDDAALAETHFQAEVAGALQDLRPVQSGLGEIDAGGLCGVAKENGSVVEGLLRTQLEIPAEFLGGMTEAARCQLLWTVRTRLPSRSFSTSEEAAPARNSTAMVMENATNVSHHGGGVGDLPRTIFLHVQNGLGNRLRALGSGLEFAFLTGRVPVVVWPRDAHLNASMADLFDEVVLRRLVVIDNDLPWPMGLLVPAHENRHEDASFVYYNRMEKDTGRLKPPPLIRDAPGKHIYLKTAYVIDKSPHAPDRVANFLLQSLQPAPAVRRMVADLRKMVGPLDRRIGVHMRTRPVESDGVALDPACEYSARGVAVANYWRAKSGPAQFVPAMLAQRASLYPTLAQRRVREAEARSWLLPWPAFLAPRASPAGARDGKAGFFVSADSGAVVDELRDMCPGCDVVSLPQTCRERGAECVVGAFADVIALSRCGALLLSGWSSFSEAAWRMRAIDAEERAAQFHGDGTFTLLFSGINFGLERWYDRVWNMVDLRYWAAVANVGDKSRRSRCGKGKDKEGAMTGSG